MPLLAAQGVPGYVALLKYLISAVIPMFVHRQATFQQSRDLSHVREIPSVYPYNSEFDFIVVGGGSAGAVIANRLSAPPNNYTVLLLEAGGDPNWVTIFPGFDVYCPNNPDIDWMYKSHKRNNNYCLSCRNKQLALTRGKGLGGSSSVNFMIYNRGNVKCFDEWAQMTGDSGWNSTNVLPFFKKSEDYNANYPNPEVHGCGGELYVDKTLYTPGLEYFLGALKDHGIQEQDLNANQTNGFMKMDQTSRDGIRWSSYSAFLRPILTRPNLHIYRYSLATKLLFDPRNETKVIGVEYYKHDSKVPTYAYAKKEVIVSAGAFDSPKLLLLSGIGPKKDLEAIGIRVVRNLPVGRNYQDHPTTMFPVSFNKSHTSSVYERDLIFDSFFQATAPSRLGPMAGNNLIGTGYVSTKYNNDATWPDIQAFISYLGLSHLTSRVFGPLLNIPVEKFDKFLNHVGGKDGNIVLVTLMRHGSNGYVTLKSKNPFDAPVIVTNFFSDKEQTDIKRLVEGFKFMVDFYEKSKTYQKIHAKFVTNPWPGCENVTFRSDEYFECYVRHVTFSLWHPGGTCKMGRKDDPTVVVDSKLRVLGIQGLRVIDASVMPKVTNGNTNAPTIMIGEKGAFMVIEDWGGINSPVGSRRPCPSNPPTDSAAASDTHGANT